MKKSQQIAQESREIFDKLVFWRRKIHENPEIGLYLPHTAAVVSDALNDLGLVPVPCGKEGVTGVTAVIDSGRPGKTILLRADMDALPLTEQNELSYCSKQDKKAHMCGHDTHTAMLLGAAALLVKNRANFCGRVKLMFQPGEEGQNGAAYMIADGVLQNPPVDAAIAMHCLTGSRWKTGTLLCATGGKAKASADSFCVTVHGKGTHGATPEHGIDVVNILTHVADAIYTIRSRELSPFVPAILSICQIHAGAVDNILPESGTLSGTLRTFDENVQKMIRRRIEEIAAQTASSFGGTAETSFSGSLRPTINDPKVCCDVFGYLQELGGCENTDVIGPVMGAEDFSEVSGRVPSVYIDLSFGSAEEGYPYAVHSPHCLFNEEALPVGAACYAWCAMRWLNEHS